jgi:hypothetical protein
MMRQCWLVIHKSFLKKGHGSAARRMALRNGESVGFNAFQLEPTKANLISLKALVGRLRDCLRSGGQAGAPLVDGVDECDFIVPRLGDHEQNDTTGRVCCRLGIRGWNGRYVWLGPGWMVSLKVST